MNAPLEIPRDELEFRASRSSGAGGQHINKTSSRVEVMWNIHRTRLLDDLQRARVVEKLASRLDSDGNLRVVASDTRSQLRNRDIAERRLSELVRHALIVPKKRKPTKPSKAAKERRLREKQFHSRKKSERRKGPED